jgi:predicted esterase
MMNYVTLNRFVVFCGAMLAAASSVHSQTTASGALVRDFWQASSADDFNRSEAALVNAASDPMALYGLVKQGPSYAADVPTGIIESERYDSQGVRFPYALLIPDSYDASQAYPVEFMLHGGVGRPKQEPGESLWRSGYDNLKKEDRIVVVPGAWRDAYWWQSTQADNLPAILRLLKQSYNVDENRVTMTGVSDGGTGAYFFAFKQPTPWAAFLPYIGHPGVLRNANSGGGYRLFFENLKNKPMYIVNGEVDRLYPASAVKPFIEILEQTSVNYTWVVIEGGGHNTQWLPDVTPNIEAFKTANPRDPLPDHLQWVTDRVDRYNRNHWLVINQRSKQGAPAVMEVIRDGNQFDAMADGAGEFTLLLSPAEVDFSKPIKVIVNDEVLFDERVEMAPSTLFKWARGDLDRSMLFLAEVTIEVPGQ